MMTRIPSSDAVGGSWENSRGFVKGHNLRHQYHEVCKALKRAARAVQDCFNEDRLPALREEEEKCQAEVDRVEAEVREDKFE